MKLNCVVRLLHCGLLSGAVMMLSGCGHNEDSPLDTPVAENSTTAVSQQHKAQALIQDRTPMPVETFGEIHHGETTYYRATGKGNCSFDESDDLLVAAINNKDYANAGVCGAYINVNGPNGSVIVRVVDRCPGCKPDGLDLSKEAFQRIAQTSAGRVPVAWQVVAGPVSGPVEYHYMDGTTRYWTAIQLRNLRWPVASLEIMPKGANEWIPVKRRSYNYFVRPRPIAAGSLRVRVTAITGAVVVDELPEPTGGLIVKGTEQFK